MKTILGVSNISFGLPASAREVVNSVFLYHATKAGLDLAIVNAREAGALRVDSGRRAAAGGKSAVQHAASRRHSRLRKTGASRRASRRSRSINSTSPRSPIISARPARRTKKKPPELPLDERLANYIIEGTKDGLIPDLDLKLQEGADPLDIINGPLMAGMTEVGRLFNNNELIVAEVLQSAEAMKAAVNLSRTVHGEDRIVDARQDRAGHREGRRPRHRQESGRDHSCRTTAIR